MKEPSIAFVFTSPRAAIMKKIAEGLAPDTSLYGFNHIPGVRHFVIPAKSKRSLFYIPALLRFKFVITQDNLLLGLILSLFSAIIGRPHWIYIAINASTLIRRSSGKPFRLNILRTIWKRCSKIVCISRQQIEDLAHLGIPKERLEYIPFGVDVDFYRPADSIDRSEGLIVSVGRDIGRDYPTLFKAAEKVPHDFIIVASKKNIPKDADIPGNVSVRFDLSPMELKSLYGKARLVVVVSKSADVPEGSDCSGQTVVLDALSAGKPVIATDRPWIHDYFQSGRDLEVVPAGRADALARAMSDMYEDADRRRRLSLSGLTSVRNQFTSRNFAASLIKVIDDLR